MVCLYREKTYTLTGSGASIWFECRSEFSQPLQGGARPNAIVLGDSDGALCSAVVRKLGGDRGNLWIK